MPPVRALLRQIISYGVVGFVQIGLDWLCFVLLTSTGIPPGSANVFARIIGAGVGFWLNGKWTFSKARLSHTALVRFVVSWAFTTTFSTAIVMLVDQAHGLHWAWIAKPIADALLAALGFTISKFWIYR